jgi:hypothetical protein
LLDLPSSIVDLTSSLVDLTSSLVGLTSSLVDLTFSLVDLTSSIIGVISSVKLSQAILLYDVSSNPSSSIPVSNHTATLFVVFLSFFINVHLPKLEGIFVCHQTLIATV